MIGRREFIALLGGAAAWPLPAHAQQAAKPTIGLLVPGTPASHGHWYAATVQRLRELGWVEGRTIAVEYRWAEGFGGRLPELAADLVQLKVHVIVTGGSTAVIAAKQATSSIPIVFAAAADPVGSGLVASLARPGGSVTGLSLQFTDLAGKRLELLRELLPGMRRLGILAGAGNTGTMPEIASAQAMAGKAGLDVITPEVNRPEDFFVAFESFRNRADALYVISDPLVNTYKIRINTLALAARIPTLHSAREHVEVGALMSYGTSFTDLFRRAGNYVDKILRGANPADLPVEQPTKFELTINLTTAKVLGIEVPPSLLARADEVIE
jgi:putative tryptophan/tyrosine transport system substrate-binding protein